jgi:hypothetical protein
MVLVCNQPEAVGIVLDALADAEATMRQARLDQMRGRFAVDRKDLLASTEWRAAADRINRLNENRIIG